MKFKKIILLLFVIFFIQNVFGQEKVSNLSNRQTNASQINFSEIIKKISTPIEGLKFSTTKNTITQLTKDLKTLKYHNDYEEKKGELIVQRIIEVFKSPIRTISIIWPIYLFFVLIWFIVQFFSVIIKPIDYQLISEN